MDGLYILLALLPILLILILMVGFHWGAARAGAAGYLTAMVLALTAFGMEPATLAYAHTKALILAFDVLFIVWMAFLHFRVTDEAGAIKVIGKSLPRLTSDKGMLALILGFAFASFLQGVGGFGVPVAIVAPLMVGLGFNPLSAVIIPSIGHSWSVTFGSLGSSFQALMAATGIPGEELELAAAVMLGISCLGAGWMVAHAADGWGAVRRLWWVVIVMSLGMALAQLGVAMAGLWNLAAVGGGLAGLLLSIPLARGFRGVDRSRTGRQTAPRSPLLLAISAYLILIAITLAVQLIPVINNALGQIALQVPFPELVTTRGFVTPETAGRPIRWFSHAGAILLYASVAGFIVYSRAGWYRTGALRRILGGTGRGMMSSSVSIMTMVAMAVIMSHAGMTDALARGLADGVGPGFAWVSPWIGALGAFMTGSNTNSNVVFSALQMRTAELLSLSVPWILAAQTAGGAIGSVIAPTKIVVGAATAGIDGREGEVISKLAKYVVGLLLLILLVTLVALWF